MSWAASEVPGNEARVLLREEALRDRDEEYDRRREGGEEDEQGPKRWRRTTSSLRS